MRVKLVIFLLLLSLLSAFAQDKNVLINREVVNASLYNPALWYNCNFIGLPLISNFNVEVHHTGFSYEDVFIPAQDGGYVLNIDGMKAKSASTNYITAAVEATVLQLGLKLKKGYLTAGLRNRDYLILGYPSDYITLIEGNEQFAGTNPAELMPFVNAVGFNELYAGWSMETRKHVHLGIRIKLLQGIANFTLHNSFAQFYTDPQTYNLTALMRLRANFSLPATVSFDTNNIPTSVTPDLANPVKSLLFNGNWGLAVDLGFIRKIRDDITIYGSVDDLGFIRWTNHATSYTGDGQFEFSGLYLNAVDLVNNADSTINAALAQLLDSLQNSFSLMHTDKSYLQAAPYTKIYLGASKDLLKFLRADLLLRADLYNSAVHPSFTAGITASALDNHLMLTVSGSYMDRTLYNVGLLALAQARWIQFYISSDNMLGLFSLRKTRNLGLQFGLNILFSCNKTERQREKLFSGDECPAYR